MTFEKSEQNVHREVFIQECRQKAWGARCNADYISANLDQLIADYRKLQEEDRTLEASIKELESAVDYHTVDNRNKRKAMQERRNALAKQLEYLAGTMNEGHKAMQQLLQSAENNLALAVHAEKWEWKEVETKPEKNENHDPER